MKKKVLSFFALCLSVLAWSCFLDPTEHIIPPSNIPSVHPQEVDLLGFVEYFVDTTIWAGGERDPSGYVIASPTWVKGEPEFPYARVYFADSALASFHLKVVRVKGWLDTLRAGGSLTPLRLFPLVHVDSAKKIELAGYFPTAVGSYWRYSVYDSTANNSYYATFRVVDSARAYDGDVIYRWVHYYNDVRSGYGFYISVARDSVRELSIASPHFLNFLWGIFPMYIGQSWRYYYHETPVETTRIVAIDTISVGGQHAASAFRIKYEGLSSGPPVGATYETRWISPYIGMVRFWTKTVGPPPYRRNELWRLMDYRIGP